MKKSRTVVKIKGLNQERVINTISKKMNVYNIKRQSHNVCKFEVDYDKKKELFSILNSFNLEILHVSAQGLKWKLRRFFTSYGIILALLVCSICYTLQYGYILKIDVVGNESIDRREIVRFVDKVLPSRQKKNIDSHSLQQSLVENFEEISSVSVAIVGQTLVININEAVLPDELQTENSAIVSQFDGLITDIQLVQGTLAVDVGEIVKKGDVLVYPYIIDSQGEQREVYPKADIWADVWISGKETHYDYKITTQRTGEKIVRNEVYLDSLLIYTNGVNCEFEDFEVEEASTFLTKNNVLPFKLKKKIYYELTTKEEKIEFSSVKNEIIEKARKKTLIFLQENEIIKEENISIKEVGGIHEVNCLITVNRNIGG